MSIFTASVQYNDFKGTVAADRSDNKALGDHLNSLGLIESDERIVGCRVVSYPSPTGEVSPSIVIYLRAGSYDEPASTIRAIEVEMSVEQLLSFFKRFDLVMTVDGNPFDGIDVDGPHYD